MADVFVFQKTNRTALMAAAASGSARVVRDILERGADINQLMQRTRKHAAHDAAKGGFFDVLTVMAAYGANFDQVDDQGNTPVHLAAMGGHANCCKFLAQRGMWKFFYTVLCRHNVVDFSPKSSQ